VCGWSLTQQMHQVVIKTVTQQRRTLAYVVLEDGTLLNAEIIKQGYGFAYTRFPFARLDEFRRLELEAREQARRLWASK
jgi:micrococcal nuclease